MFTNILLATSLSLRQSETHWSNWIHLQEFSMLTRLINKIYRLEKCPFSQLCFLKKTLLSFDANPITGASAIRRTALCRLLWSDLLPFLFLHPPDLFPSVEQVRYLEMLMALITVHKRSHCAGNCADALLPFPALSPRQQEHILQQ